MFKVPKSKGSCYCSISKPKIKQIFRRRIANTHKNVKENLNIFILKSVLIIFTILLIKTNLIMKNIFFTLLFLGFTILTGAQNTPIVGDAMLINAPNSQNYSYIKFPKPNILIKRGVVSRYKSVYGNAVVIEEVVTKDNGTIYVNLRKKDGSKFFGYLTKVQANYSKAIEAKEIAVLK